MIRERRVSVDLTYKSLSSLTMEGQILGLLDLHSPNTVNDDHFLFLQAQKISIEHSGPESFAIEGEEGKAIGGYFLRRDYPPGMICSSKLVFPRDGYKIVFKVYSNDTCPGSWYGVPYTGAIVSPQAQLEKGVIEMFDKIKRVSQYGVVAELSELELESVRALVVEDLQTHKHTQEAIEAGQELDRIFIDPIAR